MVSKRSAIPSSLSPSAERSPDPRFTIAIPTFNRAHWLRSCVASALSQTVESFEVVVSDNASDDATPEVLGEFDDERLSIIRQPRNIGPIGNWNACLSAAKALRHHAQRRRQCRAVLLGALQLTDHRRCRPFAYRHSRRRLRRPYGLTRPATRSRVLRSGVWQGTEILKEFLRGNISPQMCTLAIKTEALRARGGFPAGWPHTGDLASWVPLLLQGKAGFINESCGAYKSHSETQTAHFALGTRLEDFDRLGSVIVDEAEQHVRDPVLLGEIRSLVQSYVTGNFIGHMAIERSRGASRREIVSTAWSWRRRLSGANIAHLRALPRPVAFFILPLPAIRLVRRSKRFLMFSRIPVDPAGRFLLRDRLSLATASPWSNEPKACRRPRRPS